MASSSSSNTEIGATGPKISACRIALGSAAVLG
jgi:hypothetical protein